MSRHVNNQESLIFNKIGHQREALRAILNHLPRASLSYPDKEVPKSLLSCLEKKFLKLKFAYGKLAVTANCFTFVSRIKVPN